MQAWRCRRPGETPGPTVTVGMKEGEGTGAIRGPGIPVLRPVVQARHGAFV